MKSHSLVLALAVMTVMPMLASCAYRNTPIGPGETWPTFESRYDKYLVQFKIPVWPGETKPCRLTPVLARDFPTPRDELCYQPYDIAPDGVSEFNVRIGISKIPQEKGLDAEGLFVEVRRRIEKQSEEMKYGAEIEKAFLSGKACIHVRHFTNPEKTVIEREFYRLPLFEDRFLDVSAEYHGGSPGSGLGICNSGRGR